MHLIVSRRLLDELRRRETPVGHLACARAGAGVLLARRLHADRGAAPERYSELRVEDGQDEALNIPFLRSEPDATSDTLVFEPSPALFQPSVIGPLLPPDYNPRVEALLAREPEVLLQVGDERCALLAARAVRPPLGRMWSRAKVTVTPVELGDEGTNPRLVGKTAAIVGVGSLGSRVAEKLAAAGVTTLILVDPDRVEPANVRRHLCGIEHVGRPKVEAVADELRRRGFPTESETIPVAAQRERADLVRAALAEADFLFCLADSSAPQHFVNHLGVHLKRPVVIGNVQLRPEPLGEVVLVPAATGGCFNCWRLQLEREGRMMRAERHDPNDYPGSEEPTPSGLPLYQLDQVASAACDLAGLSRRPGAEGLVWLMALDRQVHGFEDLEPRRVSLEPLEREPDCRVC